MRSCKCVRVRKLRKYTNSQWFSSSTETKLAMSAEAQYRVAHTVDHAPSVLAPANLLSLDDNGLLRSNNCEGDDVLDLSIKGAFLLIQLVVIVGVHLEVVEGEFLLDSLLESSALLESEGVGLGDDGHNVHDIRKLLQNDNIDGLEASPG